jgi:hypothetical protein
MEDVEEYFYWDLTDFQVTIDGTSPFNPGRHYKNVPIPRGANSFEVFDSLEKLVLFMLKTL